MIDPLATILAACAVAALLALILLWALGVRYIPHRSVGIVESLWSPRGSLAEGRILALSGEAGFQADLLRGGLHLGWSPLRYRIHVAPLVAIAQGRIGYIYARDGEALDPSQALARMAESNDFQDARSFLEKGGQRGRQRAILREGVYAVNLAEFVVIAEDRVYTGPGGDHQEYLRWQKQLGERDAFAPVVIGLADRDADTVGIVTVHDGASLLTGEIIAPEVADHSCFQDPEAFLANGGRRGKQLQVLTDGTFFLNRWFATVEVRPKTVIPIGYVGVVVGYYGVTGEDVTGDGFRYGEQVEAGHRGVWKRALPPGKYALNPYALKVEHVPTVNFVLRWITGQVEAHEYDKDLKSLELITADGYEPLLPLSLVLHIDYEKAPRVVQRFGDVKRLISQTLDPILSAYFRDAAQSSHMLDLLTKREQIQLRATEELGRRFKEYDINCVAVMIGRPESRPGTKDDPIEHLFNQLRMRRLAEEQIATYGKQEEAATQLQALHRAEAQSAKQTELTQTEMDISITANRGEAKLAEARRAAKSEVARAAGQAQSRRMIGRAEAETLARTGLAEAAVNLEKVRSYGDPRLLALTRVSEALAQSRQPLVPERLVTSGGGQVGTLNQILELILAEKTGVAFAADAESLGKLDALRASLDGQAEEPLDLDDAALDRAIG